MENFIYQEYFQNSSSFVTHLYVLYSLCGGMFFEKYIRIKFKCIISVYCCVAYYCCVIPTLKILIRNSHLQDIFNSLGFFLFINCSFAVICTIYRKRNEFHRLFDIINGQSNALLITPEVTSQDDYMTEINITRIQWKTYSYYILFLLSTYLGKLCATLSDYSMGMPFQPNPRTDFAIPYACEDCNTLTSYLVSYNLSFVMAISFGTTILGTLFLLLIIGMHLKNRAVVLQNDIRYCSNLTFRNLEKICEEEEPELGKKNPDKFKLRNITQQRKKYTQEYMLKVTQWIKMHQDLIKFINQYQACTTQISELIIAHDSLTLLFLGYFISSFVIDDDASIYEAVPLVVVHLVGLMVYCSLGNALDDVSGMIYNVVYFMPWYYLPVEDQKIILNFLTLSQQTQELRVFGVFSLSLELFPRIVNEVYGYIQIMRLLVMRDQKHKI